jgi:hypothetical protein
MMHVVRILPVGDRSIAAILRKRVGRWKSSALQK